MRKSNIWDIFGMIASLGLIIIGFVYYTDYSGGYYGKPNLAFGADFYTEMYNVTKDTYTAVVSTRSILSEGFGLLFMAAGVFLFLIFGKRLTADVGDRAKKGAYFNAEGTCENTSSVHYGNSGNSYDTTNPQVQNEKSYFDNYNTVPSSQTKSAEERGRTYYDNYGINTPLHQRPREKEKSYFDNQSLNNYKMKSLPDDENK